MRCRFHSRQAAGSCRENDGGLLVDGAFQGIEIKGSGGKGAARTTFSFKDIRLQGARWRHLFLLGRIYQPASWRTVADVEPAVWLGYGGWALTHSRGLGICLGGS